MGRHTWESLSRPLPGRQNIVITRKRDFIAPGAIAVGSLVEALRRATLPAPAYCIGGAQIYAEALPIATLLYVTEIQQLFNGDVYFPPFNRQEWRERSRIAQRIDGANGFAYQFVVYERR